jgi:hypothetical protein
VTSDIIQTVVDTISIQIFDFFHQELSFKRIDVDSFCEIAQHSADLAQSVINSCTISNIDFLFNPIVVKLKQQVFSTLDLLQNKCLIDHEHVVEGEIFEML